VDGEEVGACRIDTCNDEVRTNMALVPEEMLLQQCHAGYNARLATRRQGVQLKIRRNEGGGKLCVCGSAGACAPNLGSNVVQLLAVLLLTISINTNSIATRGGVSAPCLLQWAHLLLVCLQQ